MLIANTTPWLFRVAARRENGGGHVARSLVLANAIGKENVTFSIDADSPYHAMIKEQGFHAVDPTNEAKEYESIWMDVYEDDFARYRAKTSKFVLIEDHKDLYSKADIYIRPFPGTFTKPETGTVYDGLSYALINPEFFKHRNNTTTPNQTVQNITIFMGRYDSVNAVMRILLVLAEIEEVFAITIVMGGAAKYLNEVRYFLKSGYAHPYQLKIDLPDLVQSFAEADLTIISGGVSALESIAVGTPSLIMNIADNKIPLSIELGKRDAARYAGYHADVDNQTLKQSILEIMQKDTRETIIKKSMSLLDGKGVQRVHKILVPDQKEVLYATH